MINPRVHSKPLKNIEILINSWEHAHHDAFRIREKVFIQEQDVPEDMEIDQFDDLAWHALAYQGDKAIGTGRLVLLGSDEGQIGRMAILPSFRGRGVGTRILLSLI